MKKEGWLRYTVPSPLNRKRSAANPGSATAMAQDARVWDVKEASQLGVLLRDHSQLSGGEDVPFWLEFVEGKQSCTISLLNLLTRSSRPP